MAWRGATCNRQPGAGSDVERTASGTTFIALDVEGTGMDPARHEIIEIAAIRFDRDRILDRFTTLVQPVGRVSLDIAVLTGIMPEELTSAPTLGEVAPALRRFVAGVPIVGQSIELDLRMLEAGGILLTNPTYDTFDLATLLLPSLPAYSLAAVAAEFGIVTGGRHRAEADADVTARVFQHLLRRIDRFDVTTLEQLAEDCRRGGWSIAELFVAAAAAKPAALFPTLISDEEPVGGPHELAFLTPRERPEPLRRTGRTTPIPAATIHAALTPGGALSETVAGFERRPQQEAMAQAVATALNEDGTLLVEAGTGTGKSLAYLLPSVLHAVEQGEPVVVSTNTLALQDQLFQKDLPALRAALATGPEPVAFTATVLKGRVNYLCLRRWFTWRQQAALDPNEGRLKAKITAWLGDTTTGDRAELRLSNDEEQHWRHVAEEEGTCVVSRCIFAQRNQCFLLRARRQAESSHLVIVNHALLLSDVMAGSRILPEYDRLVVDEAHHLEDQATAQFGTSLGEHHLIDFLDNLVRLDGMVVNGALAVATAYLAKQGDSEPERQRTRAAQERLEKARAHADAARGQASRLFGRIGEIGQQERRGGGFDRTVRLTDAVRRDSAWVEIELLWEPLAADLLALDELVRWNLQHVEMIRPPAGDELAEAEQDDIAIELGLAVRAGAELAMLLQSALVAPSRDQIYWIERSVVMQRPSLHSAPLSVGEMLRSELFGPLRTAVLTSATLTTDGTFDYIADRVGLEDAAELMVASPFDYQKSTLLYLADDMPEPNAMSYQQRLNETLIDLCRATRGRALVLFTSHAALQATARAIKGPLEDEGIVVLGQRIDGSSRHLIERLRTTPNMVVLGTATFWEGVDIVGPALSLLVITKLPFSVPADPVFAARSELFDDPFNEYAVPQAVLKFKQGFGRLIRSGQDRGVCAVLDRRLLSKRYGNSFVQSLPDCSIRIGSAYDLPGEAADWLDPGYAD